MRFPEYHIAERKMSPFVAPNNYDHHTSFNMIHKSPCSVKFYPDCTQGSDCFTLVGGTTRIYAPAFEKPNERRKLIEKTKDLSCLPRAPLPRGLNSTTVSSAGAGKE